MNPTINEGYRPVGQNERVLDGTLVNQLWAGDAAALGMLYDRYSSLVYSIAMTVLRNVGEAEDLTQEVFLILVRSQTYNPQRGSLSSYLTTLTRSRSIDRLRSQSTRHKYLDQWQRNRSTVEVTPMPMDHVTQQERRVLVRNALASLKDRQRQVLELSYYEGQSQSEIAQRLEVPLGTVKSWARRGLLQLREHLREALGEESS